MPPSGRRSYPTVASRQLVREHRGGRGISESSLVFPFGGNNAWPPIVYNFGPGVNYDQETRSSNDPATTSPAGAYAICAAREFGRQRRRRRRSLCAVPGTVGYLCGLEHHPTPQPLRRPARSVSRTGGYWPFQETRPARISAGDPRPSLEERYGTHAGYVCVVTAARTGLSRRASFSCQTHKR